MSKLLSRRERLVRNQEMFRDANKRLHDVLNDAGASDNRYVPFLCECADEECLARLEATLEEFEEVHIAYNHYFILSGHPRVEAEETVDQNDRFVAVVKERV
jgi:hypothetical protein